MNEQAHREALARPYAFPSDVKVLPVTELADHVRERIGGNDGDFAIARPGHRTPSRLVDRDTLELLKEFETPTPIGQAIVRFAGRRGLDPEDVLEQAFPVLQTFTASLLLVPEDSAFAEGVVATFLPGQVTHGYEVRRLVQVLQDTEVYFARGPGGDDVALKVVRSAAVAGARPMLDREAEILHVVRGTSAPQLLEVHLEGDSPFLALEWLSGVSANTRAHELRTTRGEGWRDALHLLVGRLLAAYAGIHDRNVVHADVHSGNVLVDAEDRVRILDYGMGRIVESEHPHDHNTRTGFTANMEPEAAGGLLHFGVSRPASFQGEQYSVASLAYTMVCGEHCTGASATQDDMVDRILHAPPFPFARHGFESWPEAERVLGRALSKDPEDRFASMRDFAQAWSATSPPVALDRARGADLESGHARAFDRVVALALDTSLPPDSLFSRAPKASVQYGAAGLALFLYRASLVRESAQMLAGADRWSRYALSVIDEADAFEAPQFSLTGDRIPPHSLYHAHFGVHAVHALISNARGDSRGVQEQSARLTVLLGELAGSKVDAPAELVLGRSGAVLGGALVLEALDATDLVPTKQLRSALREATEAVWQSHHRIDHLGVAHGMAGLLYAQLVARRTIGAAVPAHLLDALNELGKRAEPRGRGVSWPGTLPHGDVQESTPDHAPGWCAGTAGHVPLWALAAEVTGQEMFTSLAEQAAWHCWEHSERAGHLCCGLSGRVFGLLRMYRHTGVTDWLGRARHLSKLSEPWLVEALGSGDEQALGLYWGVLGPLLAWVELEEPERATMPLFGSEGWRLGATT